MASSTSDQRAQTEKDWFIVGRWEDFEGEGRANLLRLIAVAAFYAVELYDYYWLEVVNRPFHLAVTFLTLAWAMLCLSILICRKQRIFPQWLKYLSTGGDVVLLTSMLTLADGPRSPLIVAYFLIIAAAALRFSLPLIWFAAGGAIGGYVFLLGFARWGELPGWPRMETVPRYYQIIFVLALVLTGVVLGQVIRRVRALAEHYAQRLEDAREAAMSSDQCAEKPLPAEQKHCYYCGALTAAPDRRCWLCQEKFAIKEAKPVPVRQSTVTPADAKRVGYAWAAMGLVGVLVCGGLALEMPGVLVVPLILTVPVMIWIVVSNRKKEGEIGAIQKALMNCAALGVVGVFVLAILAAFVVICTVGQLGVHP